MINFINALWLYLSICFAPYIPKNDSFIRQQQMHFPCYSCLCFSVKIQPEYPQNLYTCGGCVKCADTDRSYKQLVFPYSIQDRRKQIRKGNLHVNTGLILFFSFPKFNSVWMFQRKPQSLHAILCGSMFGFIWINIFTMGEWLIFVLKCMVTLILPKALKKLHCHRCHVPSFTLVLNKNEVLSGQ